MKNSRNPSRCDLRGRSSFSGQQTCKMGARTCASTENDPERLPRKVDTNARARSRRMDLRQRGKLEGKSDRERPLRSPAGKKPRTPTRHGVGRCDAFSRKPVLVRNARPATKTGHEGPIFVIGRGGGIRTHDPLPPRQMRYQAALRPDRFMSAHDNGSRDLPPKIQTLRSGSRSSCSSCSSSSRIWCTIWCEMLASILPCWPSRRARAPVIVKP
jgi:hypothetical protein